jgi:Tfp pilus assembly protein PilN
MRAVNLIPADGGRAKRKKSLPSARLNPLVLLAIAVAVAVVAGVVVEYRSANRTVAERQQALTDVQIQIAKVPKPDVPRPGVTSRLSVLTSVAPQRTSWDGFLSAFSRVVPEDVWLTTMSASSTASTTTAAPTAAADVPSGFSITGYTYSQPSVARLMRRLTLVPWLSNVNLTQSQKVDVTGHRVFQFTLGADVIPLPEVTP